MGTIKTAMELALERTAGLKADRAGAQESEARKAGMRIAAAWMEAAQSAGQAPDVKAALAALPEEGRGAAREGLVDALLSALQFPRDEVSRPPLEAVSAALSAAAQSAKAAPQISGLCAQLGQFFDRYVQDIKGLEEELKRQFGPKLKQKEQELKRRTGQDVKIDPLRDPEFLAYYQKNMNQVKARYQEALDQAKADLRALAL